MMNANGTVGVAVAAAAILCACHAQPPASPPSASLPRYRERGWDPGIRKRCAFTGSQPSLAAPFAVTGACDGSLDDPRTPRWTIGLHSEKSYRSEDACAGRFDLDPVRNPESPIRVEWLPQPDDAYDVRIAHDFLNKTHPCGDGYFNWVVVQDANGGRFHPAPGKLATLYRLWFDCRQSENPPGGAVRVIAGWQGSWPDARGIQKTREVEVSLLLEGWGDAEPDDARVVARIDREPKPSHSGSAQGGLDYVHVDGRFYGLELPKRQEREILVDWAAILADLTQAHALDTPADGSTARTGAVWVGMETETRTRTGAIAAELVIRDFRILEKSYAR